MADANHTRAELDELRWIVNGFLEWHEGAPCPNGLIERARAAVPNLDAVTEEAHRPEIIDAGFLYERPENVAKQIATPTVLLGFPPNDYEARDAFVRAWRAAYSAEDQRG
jgi:hypothetical protein